MKNTQNGNTGRALVEVPCSASEQWNHTGWQDKERFLLRHGFKTGWSSHTWKYLDRPIQAAWEANKSND